MNETVVKAVKQVTTLIGGVGVAAIIGNAVKHVSPTNGTGLIMKACVGLGSMLLGGLACDATAKYAEEKIDEAVELIQSTEENIVEPDKEVAEA